MYQVDNATASATLDAPGAAGTPGYFTDGDSATARARTILQSDYMNMLMMEIINAVTSQGLTPSKTTYNQLAQAMARIGPKTGDTKTSFNPTPDLGWVRAADGTIGSAASAASARANADTFNLYSLLWNSYSDTQAPVTGGRGVSASADYASNKPIQLGRTAGRAMGVAGQGAGLTLRNGGDVAGQETVALSGSQNGLHGHAWVQSDHASSGPQQDQSGGIMTSLSPTVTNRPAYTGVPTSVATETIGGSGNGDAHENMSPMFFGFLFIKL